MGQGPINFPPALGFLNDEETLLAFLATVVLALVTGIFLLWSQTNTVLERTIVLVGPEGAGKTAIFAALTQSARPPTHSSLTPSTSHFLLGPPPPNTKLNTGLSTSKVPKKFKVVDYPGHRRLTGGLKDLLSREVGGKKRVAVVFVVDGSARDKEVGSVVDSLLPLLPFSIPPSPTPILLLSTKLDLLPSPSSRSLAVPKLHTSLTRELNARRAALAAEGARVTELGDDGGEEGEEMEEILRSMGGGVDGKWRWEDWKGVAWAGGFVGAPSTTPAKRGKKNVLEVKHEDGEVVEKEVESEQMEDGLGELKEWLWNLK